MKACQTPGGEQDPTLEKIREMTKMRSQRKNESQFVVQNGIFYLVSKHRQFTRGGELQQVVIPEKLRKKLMKMTHDSILGGHHGVKKTAD